VANSSTAPPEDAMVTCRWLACKAQLPELRQYDRYIRLRGILANLERI
jgi:hypothetical protein